MAEHEHDDEIGKRYRELAREEPPRAVDDAILAAARRELETRPAPLVAPTGRRRWMFPVAAAAVIVLSAVVTLHIQREQTDLELATAPPPSPATPRKDGVASPQPRVEAPTGNALPKQSEEEASGRKEAAGPARERRQAELQSRAKPPLSVPSPVPRAMETPSREAPSRPAGEARQFAPDPAPATPPAAAAPRAPEAAIAARSAPPAAERDALVDANRARAQLGSAAKRADLAETPERMLERLAALRREGRHKEADDLYAEFRRRFPEYRIPEPIREQVLPR